MTTLRKTVARALRVKRADLDGHDPDCYDSDLTANLAPHVDRACRAWFRLEVDGIDRVPEGPALLVGNHNAGITMLEAFGVGARWVLERGFDDPWHGLAHDAIVDLPGLGKIMLQLGALRASHESAQRAFALGRKVVVFPGGNREAFRPWSERHRIAMGDRRGFIRLALRHQVPIVPMVYIGGHDSLMVVHDGQRFARLIGADRWLRVDTWPIFLGLPWGVGFGPIFHLPLPVKCITRFLDPIPTDPYGPESVDDPAVVDALYDQVVTAMQAELDRLSAERGATGAVRGLRTTAKKAVRRIVRR